MSQTLKITVHRDNSLVLLGPKATDNSTDHFGPLSAGQYVEVEKGDYVDGEAVSIDVWDAADYAADQAAQDQPTQGETIP